MLASDCFSNKCKYAPKGVHFQGRRRLLKSGPAEEVIECCRHERGESKGRGVGGLPRENF